MADLSGRLIAGTGSFEVKGISPPIESGQLFTNGDFATGDWTGWDVHDANWSIVADPNGGYRAYADASISAGNLRQDSVATIGRYYKLSFIIEGSDEAGDFAWYDGLNINWLINAVNKRYTVYFVAAGVNISMRAASDFTGYLKDVSFEEVPEGYPLLDKGTKFLECTSAGTVAIPSDVAYGEWEFKFRLGNVTTTSNQRIAGIICQEAKTTLTSSAGSYIVDCHSGAQLRLWKNTGSFVLVGQTADDYLEADVVYELLITRALDGAFKVYIKGGDYGVDDWTLAISGTDNDYTSSKYFVLEMDDPDIFTNLEIRNLVRQ